MLRPLVLFLCFSAVAGLTRNQQESTRSGEHAGHEATHVTRLHRYDHSGPESFFQAEMKWDPSSFLNLAAGDDAYLQTMVGKDKFQKEMKDKMVDLMDPTKAEKNAKDFRKGFKKAVDKFQNFMQQAGTGLGLQLMQKSTPLKFDPFKLFDMKQEMKEKRKWGTVSNIQIETLQKHRAVHEANTNEKAVLDQANMQASEMDKNEIERNMDRVEHNVRQPDYHVTQLSNLFNSQYVGPIGVGTTKSELNCVLPAGQKLQFISNLDNLATEAEKKACHLSEESQVWVVYDTGSTNVWVSSDFCDTPPCTNDGRHRFNHRRSATFTEPSKPVQLDITFGTGELKGPQGVDDLHVGPFTVRQQTFGLIERELGNVFNEVPFEGIVGLAFPAMSAGGVKPFFDNVIHQKIMKKNEFAFYFNADDKAGNGIFWGGVDPKFYEGKIQMFPVTQPYYWSLDLEAFKIGETEIEIGEPMDKTLAHLNPFSELLNQKIAGNNQKPKLIVDSGTTYFTAEGTAYNSIMRILKSAPCSSVTDKTHPPLRYFLKDSAGVQQEFSIPSDEYMVSNEEGTHCEPAFMRIDVPRQYGPAMLLGEVFMRNYFTVFDRADGNVANAQIGFARSKKGEEINSRLKTLTSGQGTFKTTHTSASMVQKDAQGAQLQTGEHNKFHTRPGASQGSSQLQSHTVKRRFKVNPFLKDRAH